MGRPPCGASLGEAASTYSLQVTSSKSGFGGLSHSPTEGPISRYFFNVYDGEHIFDKTGTELADKREIRLHMLATALALFEDEEKQKAEWQMEAIDDRGRIVSTMTFGVMAKGQTDTRQPRGAR